LKGGWIHRSKELKYGFIKINSKNNFLEKIIHSLYWIFGFIFIYITNEMSLPIENKKNFVSFEHCSKKESSILKALSQNHDCNHIITREEDFILLLQGYKSHTFFL